MFHIYGCETKQFDYKKEWRREKGTQRNEKAGNEKGKRRERSFSGILPHQLPHLGSQSHAHSPPRLREQSMDQPVKIRGQEGSQVVLEVMRILEQTYWVGFWGPLAASLWRIPGQASKTLSPQGVGASLIAWKTWLGITKRINEPIFWKVRKIPGRAESPLSRLGHVPTNTKQSSSLLQPTDRKPSIPGPLCRPPHEAEKAKPSKIIIIIIRVRDLSKDPIWGNVQHQIWEDYSWKRPQKCFLYSPSS